MPTTQTPSSRLGSTTNPTASTAYRWGILDGMRYSWPCGIVICCDGTEAGDKRIARVLWNYPATGVMRHPNAGYDIAKQCAVEQGLKLPMG